MPKTLYPKKKKKISINRVLMFQGFIIIFLLIVIAFFITAQSVYSIILA